MQHTKSTSLVAASSRLLPPTPAEINYNDNGTTKLPSGIHTYSYTRTPPPFSPFLFLPCSLSLSSLEVRPSPYRQVVYPVQTEAADDDCVGGAGGGSASRNCTRAHEPTNRP